MDKKDRVPFFGNILDAVTQFIPDYVPPGTPSLDRFGTKKSFKDEIRKSRILKNLGKRFVFEYSPGNFDDYWNNYSRYIAKPIKEKLNALRKIQRKELKEMVRENTNHTQKEMEKFNFLGKF